MRKKKIYIDGGLRLYSYSLSKEQLAEQINLKAGLVWTEHIQSKVKLDLDYFQNLYSPDRFCNLHHDLDHFQWPISLGTKFKPCCDLEFLLDGQHRDCKNYLDFKSVSIEHFLHSDVHPLFVLVTETKKVKLQFRFKEITDQIEATLVELREKPCGKTVLTLRKLFYELHSLFARLVSRQQRSFRRIYTKGKVHRIKDSWSNFRNRAPFLIKHIPDFSDCDEHDGFNTKPSLKPDYSNSQLKKLCTTYRYCSAPLIPLWNLHMTG